MLLKNKNRDKNPYIILYQYNLFLIVHLKDLKQ